MRSYDIMAIVLWVGEMRRSFSVTVHFMPNVHKIMAWNNRWPFTIVTSVVRKAKKPFHQIIAAINEHICCILFRPSIIHINRRVMDLFFETSWKGIFGGRLVVNASLSLVNRPPVLFVMITLKCFD